MAPPYYPVTAIPHSFGSIETDRAEVDGIELELAAPACGTLHIQIYVRTFSGVEPEELEYLQSVALDFSKLPEDPHIRLPLDRPLHSARPAGKDVIRRIEILLAFTGEQTLALRSPPRPYPARHGKSIAT
jgi:hypothetical protein